MREIGCTRSDWYTYLLFAMNTFLYFAKSSKFSRFPSNFSNVAFPISWTTHVESWAYSGLFHRASHESSRCIRIHKRFSNRVRIHHERMKKTKNHDDSKMWEVEGWREKKNLDSWTTESLKYAMKKTKPIEALRLIPATLPYSNNNVPLSESTTTRVSL